jgi:hypothetical protein
MQEFLIAPPKSILMVIKRSDSLKKLSLKACGAGSRAWRASLLPLFWLLWNLVPALQSNARQESCGSLSGLVVSGLYPMLGASADESLQVMSVNSGHFYFL